MTGTAPPAADTPWWARPPSEAMQALGSSDEGLSDEEAALRLARDGPNRIELVRPASALAILASQFRSLVVVLLIVAAAIAAASREWLDALAIGAVVLLNAAIGFATEMRARRAMEGLRKLDVPRASVLRAGTERTIDAGDLVCGDLVVVTSGDAVPADARLVAAVELQLNESVLTGESLPVQKSSSVQLDALTPLPDRATMLYKGTIVTVGRGLALVVATGPRTEVGRIGILTSGIEPGATPLEKRLDALGRRLVVLALLIAASVALLGLLRGDTIRVMLQRAIAMAVAAVPEGLPAVATIAMAIGLHRMSRRRALVRRLPAVESLGSVTVVCTDKTGTLTTGELTATVVWAAGHEYHVTGAGYAPAGEFRLDGQVIDPRTNPALDRLLRTALFARRGVATPSGEGWSVTGDPIDAALDVAATKSGLQRRDLVSAAPEVGEIPFRSDRPITASLHQVGPGRVSTHVKGATWHVLGLCTRWLAADGERTLDEDARARLMEVNDRLARRGLRIVALASVEAHPEDAPLGDALFLGFVGFTDPPAAGVAETIAAFRRAGIRTMMLTGDQRLTALAVGRELGLAAEERDILDGRTVGAMPPEALAEAAHAVSAFSRISPEHKLHIVEALQARGEIVAMLGDGVNDAAALRRADVGVAMGRRGTDAARDAAAIVLGDDRFATIGAAIEEGRILFDNIRRSVFYLFSCNFAELVVLFVTGLVGVPLPLLPLQILWLNLLTDTFPALSLAFEPADERVMQRPPRDPRAALLSGRFVRAVVAHGLGIAAAALAALLFAGPGADAPDRGRTLIFTTLGLAQVAHLYTARRMRHGERRADNPWAVRAALLVTAVQAVAILWTPLRALLHLTRLSASDWAAVAVLSLVPVALSWLMRRLSHPAPPRAAAAPGVTPAR